MDLVSGQNTVVDATNIGVHFEFGNRQDVDIVSYIFLLDDSKKVASNADFIYPNNPSREDICVCQDTQGGFSVILTALPASMTRLVFALSLPEGKSFQHVGQIDVAVHHFLNKKNLCRFSLNTQGHTETALVMGELYLRNGQWKFKALGQGFVGGLEPLAQRYGVDLNNLKSTPPAPANFTDSNSSKSESESKGVNLSKITLRKKGNSVSLEKQAQSSFGEILINLNWAQPKKSLFGRSKNVDLDLGCLFAFQDGFVGGVQALGNMFGSLDSEPYIRLDADDRTGASTDGENLRINGQHWDKIQRILVFAFIYEGVPNWSQANAVVKLKVSKQPEVKVRLDSHNNRRTMCAVAMLENDHKGIKVTKLVDYFSGHEEMDKAYHWGLKYVAGSK